MKLKNILIVVKDLEKAKTFYHDLFGLDVILDQDGNVILTEGLVLQDEKIWANFLKKHADGAFYIFDSTEIIVAVYITAWNAKYQGWYGFSCKADLACVSAAASSYCILVGNAHGIAQFMCVL